MSLITDLFVSQQMARAKRIDESLMLPIIKAEQNKKHIEKISAAMELLLPAMAKAKFDKKLQELSDEQQDEIYHCLFEFIKESAKENA